MTQAEPPDNEETMTIKKIDHIAIVVPDIDEALTFWRDALGLNLSHIEEVPGRETLVAITRFDLPRGQVYVQPSGVS